MELVTTSGLRRQFQSHAAPPRKRPATIVTECIEHAQILAQSCHVLGTCKTPAQRTSVMASRISRVHSATSLRCFLTPFRNVRRRQGRHTPRAGACRVTVRAIFCNPAPGTDTSPPGPRRRDKFERATARGGKHPHRMPKASARSAGQILKPSATVILPAMR
jgi:hypothetical protein